MIIVTLEPSSFPDKLQVFFHDLENKVIPRSNDGHVPYRDSVGNRVLVHLKVLLYPLGVGLTLN